MVDLATPRQPAPPNAKTVQEYLDELPAWSDGTTLVNSRTAWAGGERREECHTALMRFLEIAG
jgi:hypothetical protein